MKNDGPLSGRNRQVCADAPQQHPWVHVNPLTHFLTMVLTMRPAALCRAAGSRWPRPPLPLLRLYTSHVLSPSPFLSLCSTPLSISILSPPLSLFRSLSFARVRVKFTNPYGALLAPLTSDSPRLPRSSHLRNRRSPRLSICMLLFRSNGVNTNRDRVNFVLFASRTCTHHHVYTSEVDQFRAFPSPSLPFLSFVSFVQCIKRASVGRSTLYTG